MPTVAWGETEEYRCATLLPYVLDEFLQIPSEGVDYLVLTVGCHLVDAASVLCCGNDCAFFLRVDMSRIVMAELYQHIVAGLDRVVDLLPTVFVEECAGTPSCFCRIEDYALGGVEHSVSLAAPSPHAVLVVVVVLYGRVAGEEHARLALLLSVLVHFVFALASCYRFRIDFLVDDV